MTDIDLTTLDALLARYAELEQVHERASLGYEFSRRIVEKEFGPGSVRFQTKRMKGHHSAMVAAVNEQEEILDTLGAIMPRLGLTQYSGSGYIATIDAAGEPRIIYRKE